jgi:hypothetical protein
MVDALIPSAHKIAAVTRNPEKLVFCCSTKDREPGLVWFHAEGD